MRRYQYQYALFSVNGFTKPAQEYALAQQISLIDLSNAGFNMLLDVVRDLAHPNRRPGDPRRCRIVAAESGSLCAPPRSGHLA
jgi:hypothetical protein